MSAVEENQRLRASPRSIDSGMHANRFDGRIGSRLVHGRLQVIAGKDLVGAVLKFKSGTTDNEDEKRDGSAQPRRHRKIE